MRVNISKADEHENKGYDNKPLEKGEYIFNIKDAIIKTSLNGFELLELKLHCQNPNRYIWQNLALSSEHSFPQYLLKQLAKACNLKVKDGYLDFECDELINKEVTLKIGIDKEGKKNVINDFIFEENQNKDNIPF
jgi:hypothetical protein